MIDSGFSLAYCTNIWSHHQAPISNELFGSLGHDKFNMCLFETVGEERSKLGWRSKAPDCKWIIGPPRSSNDLEKMIHVVCNSDVAVLGDCPSSVHAARVETGKLTFIMSERMWKKPFYWWRMLNPRFSRGIKRFKNIANRTNVHYLAMGAYAASDVKLIGAYGDRLWNWAYFTEVNPIPPKERENTKVCVLWVGRMLRWKRVDLLIKAIARVQHNPAFGRLDIVGNGLDYPLLIKLSQKLKLSEKCFFHEPVPSNKVLELMQKADIYVLPSDRNEGWGAVSNEAMSEGAVLIANEECGSSKVLIADGSNGFLFQDGNVDSLATVLQRLIGNSNLRETTRQNAWSDMMKYWHPRVGAERFVRLCHGILGFAPMPMYQTGPCSHVSNV